MPVAGIPPLDAAAHRPEVTHTAGKDGYAATCYHQHVPDFAEAELERLYGSFFSSLATWQAYGGLAGVSTYVLHREGQLQDIWLFQRQGSIVRLLNEQIAIHPETLRRFAAALFAAEPEVGVIRMNAVQADPAAAGLPYHRGNCTEDSVVSLPADAEAYLERLGKATRKNIRRYGRRLEEKYPSFHHRVCERGDIREKDVRAIIALNRVRMANKGRLSANDEPEVQRMLGLLRTHGMVLVATMGDKVCMGAIAFRFGDHYFSQVRAHDPLYDDDRLGMIGAFLLVSACIARGARELHFMWGRENHKAMFLGEQRDFDHVLIFRSRLAQLRHAPLLGRAGMHAARRQGKLWLLEKARQEEGWGRLLGQLLEYRRQKRQQRLASWDAGPS